MLRRVEFDNLSEQTELTLVIEAKDERQIAIADVAFAHISYDNLKLHVVFTGSGDNRVYLPANCAYLFADSSSIYSIDFGGVNTKEVTAMRGMCFKCRNISELDLNTFNTERLSLKTTEYDRYRSVNYMFWRCDNLKRTDISSFTYSLTEEERNECIVEMFYQYKCGTCPDMPGAEDPSKDLKFRVIASRMRNEYGVITRDDEIIRRQELKEKLKEDRKQIEAQQQAGEKVYKKKCRWYTPVVNFFDWVKRKVSKRFGL